MSTSHATPPPLARNRSLKTYYFIRAGVSLVWVAAAFTVGQYNPGLAIALLIAYPLWDAAANYWDARRNGGLARNRTQTINVAVSLVVTLVVAYALLAGTTWVLAVFGVWATLAGLLQLATAVRRWKAGAQWAMILSGGQSALVGALFVTQAHTPITGSAKTVAGYAALGAVYFLISGIWLSVKEIRAKSNDAETRTERLYTGR
jgi:uncharacterized membrane protein HdeD (DUF308 family)